MPEVTSSRILLPFLSAHRTCELFTRAYFFPSHLLSQPNRRPFKAPLVFDILVRSSRAAREETEDQKI